MCTARIKIDAYTEPKISKWPNSSNSDPYSKRSWLFHLQDPTFDIVPRKLKINRITMTHANWALSSSNSKWMMDLTTSLSTNVAIWNKTIKSANQKGICSMRALCSVSSVKQTFVQRKFLYIVWSCLLFKASYTFLHIQLIDIKQLYKEMVQRC